MVGIVVQQKGTSEHESHSKPVSSTLHWEQRLRMCMHVSVSTVQSNYGPSWNFFKVVEPTLKHPTEPPLIVVRVHVTHICDTKWNV